MKEKGKSALMGTSIDETRQKEAIGLDIPMRELFKFDLFTNISLWLQNVASCSCLQFGFLGWVVQT